VERSPGPADWWPRLTGRLVTAVSTPMSKLRPDRVGISRLVRLASLLVVVRRLVAGGRPRPPIASVPVGPAGAPGITVVVPARNEAQRLPALLDALAGAPAVAEIVVVDDQSDDDTAEIAASGGARVVTGADRPEGWAGKTWAVQQGVAAATTEWVVTLDADTRPHADLPASIVARMRADDIDLLTVGGRFECPTPGGRWLHIAMLTTLVYRFGPPGGSRDARTDRLLANGQCMAFRRSDWVRSGGFGAVAGSVVEDVALARHLASQGRRVAFLDASDLLSVRMFETVGDTWRGWGRSLGLPGVEPTWRRVIDVGVLAATMPLPLVRLLSGRVDIVDAATVAVRVGTLFGTRRAYTRNDVAYWASPLADLPAVAALALSLLRRTQSWRGRTYQV
jgi:dolichol-phosphate mannosyltransferase